MAVSRNVSTTKLSKSVFFSVEDSVDKDHKKITVVYKDPDKKYGDNIMLVEFPPDDPVFEQPMYYDEKNKQYITEIVRPDNVCEMLLITDAKVPNQPENETATRLQRGYLWLKDGVQQSVNENPEKPSKKLEIFLFTQNGELERIDDPNPDKKTLKTGERFISVYTPANYDPHRNTPYNLQITLDGRQYKDIMNMNIIFDSLIEKNEIEPTVIVFISPDSGPPNENAEGFGVVMPNGWPLSMRLKEYFCNPDFADKLATLPHTLNKEFNVTQDPQHTTIWGMSAGGVQAVYTALLYPEVYGNVVAQSPAAWNIPTQNGENWREGIIDKKAYDEAKEEYVDITWTTAQPPLPEKEGEHKEYLTELVRTGFDEISHGKINPKRLPVRFYFDAGIKEREYNAKAGSANLVKSTELLAEELEKKKEYTVVDDCVHMLPGDHHTMTWMRNIADAASSVHPPKPGVELAVTKSKEDSSSLTRVSSQSIFSTPQDSVKSDKDEKRLVRRKLVG